MRRSPARFVAPIALVAFSVALYTVVQDASQPVDGDGTPASEATATATATKSDGKKKSSGRKRKRRTYTVKSGDTPSSIAEKTGVSLTTLMELNPDLDPQTLNPGQRIKLSG